MMQHALLTRLRYLLLALPLFLAACDDDTETVTPTEPQGKYSTGVFVVNEGNFSDGDGSISFYDTNNEESALGIFETENGFPVGGLIQNMKIHDGKAYLMTNRASQLLVVDAASFEEEANLTELVDPFDFAALAEKGYVSVWDAPDANFAYPDSYIAILDLVTQQVLDTIQVGQRVAGMLAHAGTIYAAVEGGNEILAINPGFDEVETRISTPAGPSRLVVDANNQLWAICTSGALVQIDPTSNTVIKTINGITGLGFNEKFAIDGSGNVMYWIANDFSSGTGAVYSLSITADTPPANPLFTTDYLPYGIGVNPGDGLLYVGEGDFTVTQGTVYRYASSGILQDEFSAGRAPSGFVFQ